MLNYGNGYHRDEAPMNRQSAYMELLKKQHDVIDRLTDRVGNVGIGTQQGFDIPYEGCGIGAGPVRVRGQGMGPQRGSRESGSMAFRGRFRGRGYGPGGPGMGPMGPGGPMRMGGPMGPRGGFGPSRPYGRRGGKGNPVMDELKTYKIYLQTMKKNMPTNQDTLALYCPACSYTCKNNMDFLNHHKSFTHKNQVLKLDDMPMWIKKEVLDSIAKIFQQRKAQKSLMFCSICDQDLSIPYSDHKNLEIHRIRSNTCKVGCLVCNVKTFKNFPDYKVHCASEDHIKKAEMERIKYDEQIETCTDLKDFPPHKDGISYGQKHVKFVEGSYCTVCKRFFYTEEEANAHTTHKSHYNHVRDLFFNKKNTEVVDMGEYPVPKPEETPDKEKVSEEKTEDKSEVKTDEKTEENSEEISEVKTDVKTEENSEEISEEKE